MLSYTRTFVLAAAWAEEHLHFLPGSSEYIQGSLLLCLLYLARLFTYFSVAYSAMAWMCPSGSCVENVPNTTHLKSSLRGDQVNQVIEAGCISVVMNLIYIEVCSGTSWSLSPMWHLLALNDTAREPLSAAHSALDFLVSVIMSQGVSAYYKLSPCHIPL